MRIEKERIYLRELDKNKRNISLDMGADRSDMGSSVVLPAIESPGKSFNASGFEGFSSARGKGKFKSAAKKDDKIERGSAILEMTSHSGIAAAN